MSYFFAPKTRHPDCSFPWALPTPDLWNKIGFSGNTIDTDVRLGIAAFLHCALPQAFLFYRYCVIVSAVLRRGL